MLDGSQKIESVKSVVVMLLSVSAQITLCTLLWKFCCDNNLSMQAKRLNVQLILPMSEPDDMSIPKSLVKHEEDKIEMIQRLQEPEPIIPENPFEQPMKPEKPVAVEKRVQKPVASKRQIVKQEPVKKVENLQKVIPEKPIVEKTTEITKSFTEVPKTMPDDKANVPTRPVLTKNQQNENSKYLAKVMKILEKNKRYSEDARKRNLQGKVIVAFAISGDGKTEKVKAKTTTSRELAEAAEKLIKNSKLPIPPKSWPAGSLVEIPISYRIK